jgi:adenosylhomocysteine nucleosidase
VIDGGAPLPGIRDRATDPDGAVRTRSRLVGVVAALQREAECLTGAPTLLLRATLVTPELLVCRCGVGEQRAEVACRQLLAAGATALVSWGVAAGLDPALAPGTLVVTAQVVTGDANGLATAAPTTSVSRRWAERVVARMRPRASVSPGPIAHADRILETKEAKRGLARTGAAAADMETRGVATVAESGGVPWIAVRAIADTSDTALPASVLGAVDESGRVRPGRLLAALARHPRELAMLPPLARGFGAALRALRSAVDAIDATLLDLPPFADQDDHSETSDVRTLG